MSGRSRRVGIALLTGLAVLLLGQPALACSVCFGDPNSQMTQGVQAGVLVLLGVIGTVLLGLASLLIFWARRAARMKPAAANDRLSAPPTQV